MRNPGSVFAKAESAFPIRGNCCVFFHDYSLCFFESAFSSREELHSVFSNEKQSTNSGKLHKQCVELRKGVFGCGDRVWRLLYDALGVDMLLDIRISYADERRPRRSEFVSKVPKRFGCLPSFGCSGSSDRHRFPVVEYNVALIHCREKFFRLCTYL